MRKMLFALILIALPGSFARAQTPVYWIMPNFGLNTLAMDDVNEEIRAIDAAMPGSMDEIGTGWSYGIAVGVDLPSALTLSLAYERILASSDYSGDPSGSLDYGFDANVLKGSILYRLSPPGPREFALGVSLGLVSAAGEIVMTSVEDGTIRGDVEGSGPLLEGFVTGDFRMTPRVALTAVAGYRMADINEFEIEGFPVRKADGSEYTLDYGGLLLRAGLKIWF